MPKVLTVDDSRSIRAVIAKQMQELGFEVGEAEDGEKGLECLEAEVFDLVLLDVTMPVMDGPTMLARMREAGNQTPVIMLTSESKRTVVAGAMKLGISNYVLKPFRADELRSKVLKALKLAAPAAAAGRAGVDHAADGLSATSAGGGPVGHEGNRQFVDILLVDDMENVQKRLRAALPEHISLNACASAQSAMSLCREKVYRILLVDTVIPDVDSGALMRQLRMLQPHAAALALSLRTSNDAGQDAAAEGFDGVLLKPFDPDGIEEFVISYFGNQDLLVTEDNVLKPAAFSGREERLDRYLVRLRALIDDGLQKVASACYEEVIIDFSTLPLRRDKSPKLVADIRAQAVQMGLELRLVGTVEVARVLKTVSDTSDIPLYGSIAEAREGAPPASAAAGGSR